MRASIKKAYFQTSPLNTPQVLPSTAQSPNHIPNMRIFELNGEWLCVDEAGVLQSTFVDVTALGRLGTALSGGTEMLLTQLTTGTIFDGMSARAEAVLWRQAFLVADSSIQIFGFGAAAEVGISSAELVAGATNLAEAVVVDEGLGPWVIAMIGLGMLDSCPCQR